MGLILILNGVDLMEVKMEKKKKIYAESSMSDLNFEDLISSDEIPILTADESLVFISVVHRQGPRSQRISPPSYIHPNESLPAEMPARSQIDVKNVTSTFTITVNVAADAFSSSHFPECQVQTLHILRKCAFVLYVEHLKNVLTF